MHHSFKTFVISFLSVLLMNISSPAQMPDHVYHPNIHTVKLHKYGDVYSYPVMLLNSGDQLELRFDDMDADLKNYYYTFQLCNADWTPANIQPFDYIRGFQTNRIRTYRNSSVVETRYTHYELIFPDRSSTITRSGNYLLKVFLDDDTSRLVFTRRFLVVNNRIAVSAQVQQPFNATRYLTHQRLQVALNTANAHINAFSPQDIKVVMVQNFNWGTASLVNRPTIFRGNYFEYSDEELTTFPAGKEWRWIDLRSLRLLSDRMTGVYDSAGTIHVGVKPDGERRQQVYVYYRDYNGMYSIENRDGYNPYWQSDYAWTHFTYVPPGNKAYEGRSVYVFGELTNYQPTEASRMVFNAEKGVYEKALWLKQGYYNYSYVTLTDRRPLTQDVSYENTEGNYWGTENSYMVLVYYRAFGARADELLGFTVLNSARQF
jgi:hypothetical protein